MNNMKEAKISNKTDIKKVSEHLKTFKLNNHKRKEVKTLVESIPEL